MTKLVAIVNVTPDSFSDGGHHLRPEDAGAHIDRVVKEGADILDLGAESTRPGAMRLGAEEEWERLKPALTHALSTGLPVSVDTRHPETARCALEAGAHWINDVGGFSSEEMLAVMKPYNCKLVAMHSLGIPPCAEETLKTGCNLLQEIKGWLIALEKRLQSHGVQSNRIILDPGIGFGKTAEQSLELLLLIGKLKTLGFPLLIGHSRKSFLSLFTDRPAHERDEETLIFSQYLALNKVDYLRVHEVSRHRRMLDIVAKLQ